MSHSTTDQISKFEQFVNNRLRPDLQRVQAKRARIDSLATDYIKLRNTIETLQQQDLKEIETLYDLGCGFYCQARIPDTSYIYVEVGLGIRVQFTLEEALRFIDHKSKVLERQAEKCGNTAAEITAHIRFTYETILQIMRSENLPSQSP